jgi:hypothetical protein
MGEFDAEIFSLKKKKKKEKETKSREEKMKLAYRSWHFTRELCF